MIRINKIIKKTNSIFQNNINKIENKKEFINSKNNLQYIYNKITNNSFEDYNNNNNEYLENSIYENRINVFKNNLNSLIVLKKEFNFFYERNLIINFNINLNNLDKILHLEKESIYFYLFSLININNEVNKEYIYNSIIKIFFEKKKKFPNSYCQIFLGDKFFINNYYKNLNMIDILDMNSLLKNLTLYFETFNFDQIKNLSYLIYLIINNDKNNIQNLFIKRSINLLNINLKEQINESNINIYFVINWIKIFSNLFKINDIINIEKQELINQIKNLDLFLKILIKHEDFNSIIKDFNLENILDFTYIIYFIENNNIKKQIYFKIIEKLNFFNFENINFYFIKLLLKNLNKEKYLISKDLANSIMKNKNIKNIKNYNDIYLILKILFDTKCNYNNNIRIIINNLYCLLNDDLEIKYINIVDFLYLIKSIYYIKELNLYHNIFYSKFKFTFSLISLIDKLENYFKNSKKYNISIAINFSFYLKKIIINSNYFDKYILDNFDNLKVGKENINQIIQFYDEILESLQFKSSYNVYTLNNHNYNNNWDDIKLNLVKNIIYLLKDKLNFNSSILFLKLINLEEFFDELNLDIDIKKNLINRVISNLLNPEKFSMDSTLNILLIKSFNIHHNLINKETFFKLFKINDKIIYEISINFKPSYKEFIYYYLDYLKNIKFNLDNNFVNKLKNFETKLKEIFVNKIITKLNFKTKIIYEEGVEQNFVKGINYNKFKYFKYLLPIIDLLKIKLNNKDIDIIILIFTKYSKILEGKLMIKNFLLLDSLNLFYNNKNNITKNKEIILPLVSNLLTLFRYYPKNNLLIIDYKIDKNDMKIFYFIYLKLLYSEVLVERKKLTQENLIPFSFLTNYFFKDLSEKDIIKIFAILGKKKNNYTINLIKRWSIYEFKDINLSITIPLIPNFIYNQSIINLINSKNNLYKNILNDLINNSYQITDFNSYNLNIKKKIDNFILIINSKNYQKNFVNFVVSNKNLIKDLNFEYKRKILLINNLINNLNINNEYLKIIKNLKNIINTEKFENCEILFENEKNIIKYNKIFENYENYDDNNYLDIKNFKLNLYNFPNYESDYKQNIWQKTNYFEINYFNLNEYTKIRYYNNLLNYLLLNFDPDLINDNNNIEIQKNLITENFISSQKSYFNNLESFMKNNIEIKNEIINKEDELDLEYNYWCPFSNMMFNILWKSKNIAYIICDEFLIKKDLKNNNIDLNLIGILLKNYAKKNSNVILNFIYVNENFIKFIN